MGPPIHEWIKKMFREDCKSRILPMSLLGQQGFSQNRDKSRDLRLERDREMWWRKGRKRTRDGVPPWGFGGKKLGAVWLRGRSVQTPRQWEPRVLEIDHTRPGEEWLPLTLPLSQCIGFGLTKTSPGSSPSRRDGNDARVVWVIPQRPWLFTAGVLFPTPLTSPPRHRPPAASTVPYPSQPPLHRPICAFPPLPYLLVRELIKEAWHI